jgi:hypothetical protein
MLNFFGLHIDLDWFYNPNDREIIRRWTVQRDQGIESSVEPVQSPQAPRHELVIEGTDPQSSSWSFLVLGDTGDSDRFRSQVSPQSAVAGFMAQDCGLRQKGAADDTLATDAVSGASPFPEPARLVLHTGDINYLTGEQRLYDINFIDPYRAFQTEKSHFNDLVFRIPFLPVPGNHDYYDLHGWVSKVLTVSSWVGLSKVLSHFFYRLGLSVPLGGSNMGAAYMAAFVNTDPKSPQPLPYKPGVSTKLPNRYYQFRQGNVHFFALDSNTLDAPPPGAEDPWKEHASEITDRTHQKLSRLNDQVQRDRDWEHEETTRQREAMRAGQHEEMWPHLQQLLSDVATAAETLSTATDRWANAISKTMSDEAKRLQQLAQQERDLHDQWRQVLADASAAEQPVVTYEAHLDKLVNLQEAWLQHLAARDEFTVTLPGAPEYEAARQSRLALDARLGSWCRERVGEALPGPCAESAAEEGEPQAEGADIEKVELSEAILDTQRDLALARKLRDRNAEDYDQVQIEWLRSGLIAVKAEEEALQQTDPNARIWRVVYMHHPVYTTLPSHTERSDSIGVRNNLEEILKDADVVLSGHSHGFEWLHSDSSPHQCYLVTGAGGMGRLQGSVFSSHLADRFQPAIESLTKAGVDTVVWASGEPSQSGGTVEDKTFSYLRINVLPDELQIEPVGVYQSGDPTDAQTGGWERIHPLTVHEVPDAASWKAGGSQETTARRLQQIRVRRGEVPAAVWTD